VRTLLNVIWFLCAGLWLALGYLAAAVLMFLLIVTIPFGVAALRLAGYVLWPFGYTTVHRPTAGAMPMLGNVLWFVLAGFWIALVHVAIGVGLCLTVVGIPFGIANFKLARVALAPLGKQVVPLTDRRAMRRYYRD
jgi:uncharacterized membrane protein YccF (DUF307 family)